MARKDIVTPEGAIFVNNSTMKAELVWYSHAFVGKDGWNDTYSETQRFVDSEIIRLCEPFTPLLTGMLIKSVQLGSKIGSGWLTWIAPYAKAQYYMARRNPSQTGPLRSGFWFDRMKQIYKKDIIKGARKIMRKRKGKK